MTYRTCVYTICCNEILNIEKWVESVGESDFTVVLDTGSTDGSREILRNLLSAHPNMFYSERDYSIHDIESFSFADMRNRCLEFARQMTGDPDDIIYISLDMDEFPNEGFFQMVKKDWKDGTDLMFVESHSEWGDSCLRDKCHSSHGGWYWKYRVHEQLFRDDRIPSDFVQYSSTASFLHRSLNTSSDFLSQKREKYYLLNRKQHEEHLQEIVPLRYLVSDAFGLGKYEESEGYWNDIFSLVRENRWEYTKRTPDDTWAETIIFEAYQHFIRKDILNSGNLLNEVSSMVTSGRIPESREFLVLWGDWFFEDDKKGLAYEFYLAALRFKENSTYRLQDWMESRIGKEEIHRKIALSLYHTGDYVSALAHAERGNDSEDNLSIYREMAGGDV